MVAKKKGKMTKRTPNLVSLPGCMGCGKVCKYSGSVADPYMASYCNKEWSYGCNSKLEGFRSE